MLDKIRSRLKQHREDIERIGHDLFVGIGAYLFCVLLGKNGVLTGFTGSVWFSLIIGAISAALYDWHNTVIGRRMAEIAAKRIIPIIAVSGRIPNLCDYATALGRVTRFDQIVITHVLSNHTELLKSNRYLLGFDGYMKLLTALSNQYQSMVCVNRTLPINWLAPIHGRASLSTRNYQANLRKRMQDDGFETRRLTPASKESILDQLSITYNWIRNRESDPLPLHTVKWFLELIQSLETGQDDFIVKVSKYFGTSNETKVKEALEAKPSESSIEVLISDIASSCENAANLIKEDFIENSVTKDKLNELVFRRFLDSHGRPGSYYMRNPNFHKVLAESITSPPHLEGNYEIGIYCETHWKPKLALRTVGGLGDLICIEITDPGSLADSINKCIAIAEDKKNTNYAGNLEDLI